MALTKVKGSVIGDDLYRRENNLSDVPDKAIARNHLDVYEKTEALAKADNLAGLSDIEQARNNLEVPHIYAGRLIGEICYFSFDTPPPGFFALDGSTIPNGLHDFLELANSGSRFITVSSNDLILKNSSDFIRGRGDSGRNCGEFEGDAIRNINARLISGNWGAISGSLGGTSGAFETVRIGKGGSMNSGNDAYELIFDASLVVPVADENRPNSLTGLICIYHGVI